MNVRELMSGDVARCAPDATMAEAARLLWDHDCGALPVVCCETGRVIGMVTDRDLCMAALIRGARLDELPVSVAMSRDVRTCHADDTADRAHAILREHQVRRLPVVDAEGCLVGILSLNDLARRAAKGRGPAAIVRQREVAKTLAAVSAPRAAALV
ncbi:MAG: CBS domain-containing protein [Planctomycetaceae bacterium]